VSLLAEHSYGVTVILATTLQYVLFLSVGLYAGIHVQKNS